MQSFVIVVYEAKNSWRWYSWPFVLAKCLPVMQNHWSSCMIRTINNDSMILMSKDTDGHSRTFTFFCCNYWRGNGALCLGSLSYWKVQDRPMPSGRRMQMMCPYFLIICCTPHAINFYMTLCAFRGHTTSTKHKCATTKLPCGEGFLFTVHLMYTSSNILLVVLTLKLFFDLAISNHSCQRLWGVSRCCQDYCTQAFFVALVQ